MTESDRSLIEHMLQGVESKFGIRVMPLGEYLTLLREDDR